VICLFNTLGQTNDVGGQEKTRKIH